MYHRHREDLLTFPAHPANRSSNRIQFGFIDGLDVAQANRLAPAQYLFDKRTANFQFEALRAGIHTTGQIAATGSLDFDLEITANAKSLTTLFTGPIR